MSKYWLDGAFENSYRFLRLHADFRMINWKIKPVFQYFIWKTIPKYWLYGAFENSYRFLRLLADFLNVRSASRTDFLKYGLLNRV